MNHHEFGIVTLSSEYRIFTLNNDSKKKKERERKYQRLFHNAPRDHIWPRPRTKKKKKKEKSRAYEKVFDFSKERESREEAKDGKRNNNSGLSIQLILSGRYLDFRCDRSIPEPGVGHCRGPQPLLCHVPTSPGCWRPRRGSCRRAGTRRSLSSSNLARARSIPSLSLSRIHTYTNTRAHVRARDQARGVSVRATREQKQAAFGKLDISGWGSLCSGFKAPKRRFEHVQTSEAAFPFAAYGICLCYRVKFEAVASSTPIDTLHTPRRPLGYVLGRS